MAEVLDCERVAEKYLAQVRDEIVQIGVRPRVKMFLAVNDSGSEAYARVMTTTFSNIGIEPVVVRTEPTELERLILATEKEEDVTGCFVFYPINFSGKSDRDFMRIVPQFKDVEGLSAENVYRLVHFQRTFEGTSCKAVVPCTPKAVTKVLLEHDVEIKRKEAVILNRSYSVGIPLQMMLNNLGATVTTCDINTRRDSVKYYLRNADIVVTAVPEKRELFDDSDIKCGAAVIDCSFEGNFDPEKIARVAGHVSFRQGRNYIGRVTTAMAAVNVLYLLKHRILLEEQGT